jgi:hypothetical protein
MSLSKTRIPLWRKLQQRTWAERWLLLEAAWWLTLLAGALRVAPFKRIVGWFGLAPASGAPSASGPPDQDALAVGWAVRAVAGRTPWTSTCLAQALAASQMLRRRGIASALTLGVALAPEKDARMEAHAWLQHGGVFLTGEGGHRRFTPISTFVISMPAGTDVY